MQFNRLPNCVLSLKRDPQNVPTCTGPHGSNQTDRVAPVVFRNEFVLRNFTRNADHTGPG